MAQPSVTQRRPQLVLYLDEAGNAICETWHNGQRDVIALSPDSVSPFLAFKLKEQKAFIDAEREELRIKEAKQAETRSRNLYGAVTGKFGSIVADRVMAYANPEERTNLGKEPKATKAKAKAKPVIDMDALEF